MIKKVILLFFEKKKGFLLFIPSLLGNYEKKQVIIANNFDF